MLFFLKRGKGRCFVFTVQGVGENKLDELFYFLDFKVARFLGKSHAGFKDIATLRSESWPGTITVKFFAGPKTGSRLYKLSPSMLVKDEIMLTIK